MMSDAWFLLEDGPDSAARNMAVDEALLERVAELGVPVLRLYRWSEPAATFGYFQKIADVETMTDLRPLVRRPTGGGLVPHDRDWTYSVAFPPGCDWYRLKALESYARLHEWMLCAFEEMAIETRLAPCCDTDGPGRCFVGAEKSDLLIGSRKIAGAAQRRNRFGLLVQGSVHPPTPHTRRADWERAFTGCKEFHGEGAWRRFERTTAFEARVADLAVEKFGDETYTRRR
jgi:lipoate-protein ligase A